VATAYYLGAPLFAFVFNIFLFIAVRIYGAARRRTVQTVFSLLLLSMALWGISIFAMRSSPNTDIARIWEYLVLGSFALVSILFLHFVLLYTNTRTHRFLVGLLYLILLPVLGLLPLSPMLLKGMNEPTAGRYALDAGPLFMVWVTALYALIVAGIVLLARAYKGTRSPDQRNRINYLIMGTVASFLGATSDYVYAAGLIPQPGGILGNVIWAGCCTVSMVRYRLLGIRMVLIKALGFVIASVIAILPFALLIYMVLQVSAIQKMSIPLTIVLLAAMALVAQPLLTWTQGVVNRWFYRRRYDVIEALRYFSEQAKYIRDLDTLVGSLVRLLSTSMNAQKVCVYAHFPPGYVPMGHAGLGEGQPPTISEGSVLIQWLMQQNQPVVREELDDVPVLQTLTQNETLILTQTEAEIIVPMRIEDDMVGIIFIGPPQGGGAYNEEDLSLLRTVSNQVALSLEGARLLAVERERLEQVRRSSELRSEFLVTIAHELKSPMTVIKAALEMLQEVAGRPGGIDSAYAQLISSAGRSARALEDLMSNLMIFGKARHQTLELHQRPVDPRAVLNRMSNLMEPLAVQKHQKFEVFVPPDTPEVMIDPDYFSHIVNNLVSNAIKYTPQEGSVRTGMWVEDSKLVLTVSDTGIGISGEDLPWIFEPYRRARGALDSGTPGTGLGLAITKALVELHNGTIKAESVVGKGSVFTVLIPQEVKDESPVRG
jgi:signal transduction histidine kinase